MDPNQDPVFAPITLSIIRSAALFCVMTVAISGCSRMATGLSFPSNQIVQPTITTSEPTVTANPVARLEQQASGLSVAGYIDPAAMGSMSEKDRAEASSAQFYALQFGRPGAPRNWSGDTGATGEVTVGPFIRVNNLDCREFSHKVTIAGTSYTRDGTSCRELNGNWRAT